MARNWHSRIIIMRHIHTNSALLRVLSLPAIVAILMACRADDADAHQGELDHAAIIDTSVDGVSTDAITDGESSCDPVPLSDTSRIEDPRTDEERVADAATDTESDLDSASDDCARDSLETDTVGGTDVPDAEMSALDAPVDVPDDEASPDVPVDVVFDTGDLDVCGNAPGQLFPPGAVWNTAVDTATLDLESAQIIAYLQANSAAGGTLFQIDWSNHRLEADGSTEHRSFTPSGAHYSPDCDTAPVPIPPGGAMNIAFRESGDLYWEDVITTDEPSPYELTGLTEGVEYAVSISIMNAEGVPSLFGLESMGTPMAALPPDDFESTSTPGGVQLNWTPRPELNTFEYIIERATAGEEFELLTTIPHPGSEYLDTDIEQGQLYLYQIKTRTAEMIIGQPGDIQEGSLASHHLGILVIDGTPDGGGPPSYPGDEEVDTFYDDLLQEFDVAGHWDRRDSIDVDVTISDADLAPYGIVYTHFDYTNAQIADDTSAFRKYLENGGKLMLSGWRMAYNVQGISGFSYGFGEGDFLFDIAGIDSVRAASSNDDAFIGASGVNGFPDLSFDAALYPYWDDVLPLMEAVWTETFPTGVEIIAEFQAFSDSSSVFHGNPVGLKGDSWIFLEVPLYYMTVESASDFMEASMEFLDAPPSGIGDIVNLDFPEKFTLSPTYPNPFNSRAVIRFALPIEGNVSIKAYDVNGRLAAEIVNDRFEAGSHEVNFNHPELSSGIYFIAMQSGSFHGVQKSLFIK